MELKKQSFGIKLSQLCIWVCSALCMLAGPLSAGIFLVEKSYTVFGIHAEQDKRCLEALKLEIASEFMGLKGVELSGPGLMTNVAAGHTILIYAGVRFKSEYSDAKGVLNCLFIGNSANLSDMIVTFEGKGLAGFKKHILAKKLKDPAKQFSKGFGRSF